MKNEADLRRRARKFEEEMAAMPVALIHELPYKEDFTLDFCMWLQTNYDRLLVLERESPATGGIPKPDARDRKEANG